MLTDGRKDKQAACSPLHLVLPKDALRNEVAREMVTKLGPVRHRAVPLAGHIILLW